MKKLIIFIFSIVLLGSCSKQKTVKFIIENTGTVNCIANSPNSPNYNNNNGVLVCTFSSGLEYSYISGDGVSESTGDCSLNYISGTSNNTSSETSPITMIKGDNVEIEYFFSDFCCNGESITFKADVDGKEHIIAVCSYDNVFLDASVTACNETINWIVP